MGEGSNFTKIPCSPPTVFSIKINFNIPLAQKYNHQNAAHSLMTCRETIASYLFVLYRLNQKPHSCRSGMDFEKFSGFNRAVSGENARFSVSDRDFVIAGKQREHLV